ncbi:CRISPR-associated endonuclease Cas2 [Clostridium kluyveri]|uniref:CRISPR-associated endoribonuclease Cas2 n=1 Tax=Clostridium kluyveri TaxID=1534 RepID=A0A1L5F7S1_CLOKL|nr:CRISPR-associated endonuclease Cas2 [Clostridium kluyveri]APM39055.1 CRISPR-associated endonuclease Cas2 [Clostridium kluyveri]UZQ51387.1 CRISPR-associated endonuclease Cas2 [Clostridium kluyveri]
MFVILVYDFGEKRVGKALKLCRRYLTWVQNSVFEGELSMANFKKLKIEIENIMDKKEDSVIIYKFNSTKYSKREQIGVVKNSQELFI